MTEVLEGIRHWRRNVNRASELGVTLPDALVLVGALQRASDFLSQKSPQVAYRLNMIRQQLNVDHQPTKDTVMSYSEHLQAEAEEMNVNSQGLGLGQPTSKSGGGKVNVKSLNGPSPGAPANKAQHDGADQGDKAGKPAGGSGITAANAGSVTSSMACKFWGTENGCRKADQCRYVHSVLNPKDNRCFKCSAVGHSKKDCPVGKKKIAKTKVEKDHASSSASAAKGGAETAVKAEPSRHTTYREEGTPTKPLEDKEGVDDMVQDCKSVLKVIVPDLDQARCERPQGKVLHPEIPERVKQTDDWSAWAPGLKHALRDHQPPLQELPTEVVEAPDWGEGLGESEFPLEGEEESGSPELGDEVAKASPDPANAPGADPENGGEASPEKTGDWVDEEISKCSRPLLYLRNAGFTNDEWPTALRYSAEERMRVLGVTMMPMLPYGASVVVKRKRWHSPGVLAPPYVNATLLAASPNMSQGWVVRSEAGQVLHVREAILPASLGEQVAMELREESADLSQLEEQDDNGAVAEPSRRRLVGKQPPSSRSGIALPDREAYGPVQQVVVDSTVNRDDFEQTGEAPAQLGFLPAELPADAPYSPSLGPEDTADLELPEVASGGRVSALELPEEGLEYGKQLRYMLQDRLELEEMLQVLSKLQKVSKRPRWAVQVGQGILEYLAGTPDLGLMYEGRQGDRGPEGNLPIPRNTEVGDREPENQDFLPDVVAGAELEWRETETADELKVKAATVVSSLKKWVNVPIVGEVTEKVKAFVAVVFTLVVMSLVVRLKRLENPDWPGLNQQSLDDLSSILEALGTLDEMINEEKQTRAIGRQDFQEVLSK
ncbi:unnamed protein product [Cladocopium goreaui]|uniref:Copia protein n=1 Tax=Cladocopium goreaui TaxID=2562237 RepID=A0A9P1FXS5_9DINO|nr:unnamed protein product [Cladocopium goreaui]